MRSGRPRSGRARPTTSARPSAHCGSTRRQITAGSPCTSSGPRSSARRWHWSPPGFPWPGTSRSPRSTAPKKLRRHRLKAARSPGERERGRDPGLYYLRVFGAPGDACAWGYRFLGGHHVSLNNLVVDGEMVATTPCFMGADPAVSPLLGGALKPAAGPGRGPAGRELARSLPPRLRQRAVLLPRAPSDLVTANRPAIGELDRVIPLVGIWRDERFPDPAEQDKLQTGSDAIDDAAGYTDADHRVIAYSAAPKGVPGSELDSGQRDLLRSLLGTYFGRVPDSASPIAAYDDAALNAVFLAWAGPLEPGAPHYYRLQGPRLLIEWDNTQRNANHAHSVWREPRGRLRPRHADPPPGRPPLGDRVDDTTAATSARRTTAAHTIRPDTTRQVTEPGPSKPWRPPRRSPATP